MKRIPQKAAVQTILYYMHPRQKVCVIDKCHPDDCVGTMAYEGTVDDLLHNYRNTLCCQAECRGLSIEVNTEGSVVVFEICTQWERY